MSARSPPATTPRSSRATLNVSSGGTAWRGLARLPRLLVRRLDGPGPCGRSSRRDEQVVAQAIDVDAYRCLALLCRHQAREGPTSKTSWLSLPPAGAPQAPLSARPCLGLPQASASLGQSAAWAALAGHIGRAFDRVRHRSVLRQTARATCSEDAERPPDGRMKFLSGGSSCSR